MLPRGRGAIIATATGDGTTITLLDEGSQRTNIVEGRRPAFLLTRFGGGALCMGILPPGSLIAATFGLFLLPRGRPCCFFPAMAELVAAEAEE
jgi:hypothetical protein